MYCFKEKNERKNSPVRNSLADFQDFLKNGTLKRARMLCVVLNATQLFHLMGASYGSRWQKKGS